MSTQHHNLNLMPFQDLPFNGDYFVCEKIIELVNQFKINFVIETGTCLGGTTNWFAEKVVFNFKKVFTIELNEIYQRVAKQFCDENSSNIEFVLGDSSNKIGEILELNPKMKDEAILFFLDAHWGNHCPLRDELVQIANNCRKAPIIVIHDFVVPNNSELGYDTYNGQPLDYNYIQDLLPSIYGEDNFEVSYNSMLMGAKRGVIFITPKKS